MERATALLEEARLLDATRFRCELTPPSESGRTTGIDATRK
jgi:hypothetical protein